MIPSDEDLMDEQLTAFLDAYDEALAAGHYSPSGSESPTTPQANRLLGAAQACLRRLESERLRQARQPAETPPGSSGPNADPAALDPSLERLPFGKQLGRFQLRRELGHGGCGIVYLAWDPLLDREVALKIPRPELLAVPEQRRRFLREGKIAAGFDHPNLVRVYEAGEIGPWCFLVSAYCAGGTLADWLRSRQGSIPSQTAARVAAVLAEAVDYIHQRGVLHRDIKPSNVLLQTAAADGQPEHHAPGTASVCDLQAAIPMLTDFGLARLAESQHETKSGELLGTPAYMAPEQAEGRHADVGPATDVYTLGVILYEMLTGRAPFRGETNVDTLRRIASEDPVEPRRLRASVPQDLQTICLKCLRKEPQQRYRAAGELADDLRRFLPCEPIHARPLSVWGRSRAWVRRRPAAAGMLGVSALALLGLLAGAVWHAIEMATKNTELERINAELVATAERERKQAELLRRRLYATRFKQALRAWERGESGQTIEELPALRPKLAKDDLRGFEWYYLKGLCHPLHALWRGPQASVGSLAVSADGLTIASASGDHAIRIWDVGTGQVRWSVSGPRAPASFVALSPDGGTVASGWHEESEIRVWDIATGKERAQFAVPFKPNCALFTPEGKQLIIGGPGFGLWDVNTAKPAGDFVEQPSSVLNLAITPDLRTVATGNDDGTVRLWDVSSRREVVLRGHRGFVWCVALSPNGRTLASGSWDKTVKLWDVATGTLKATLEHRYEVFSVTFSSDGRTLASSAAPHEGWSPVSVGEVKLWDVATGQPLPCAFDRIPGKARSLAFVPGSRLLALGCADKTIKLLDTGPEPKRESLPGHAPKETWAVAFSPDSRSLASGGDDHLVKLWDAKTGGLRATLEGHGSLVTALAYSTDGRTLASASFDKKVKLWDADTGQLRKTLIGPENRLRCVAFSPDGRHVAAGDYKGAIHLWNAGTGQALAPLSANAMVRGVAFSPDGKTLASASKDGKVRFWDTSTWQLRKTLDDTDEVACLAFAPDGKTLVGGNHVGVVRLWDVATGHERTALRGHIKEIYALAFSLDGRTIASAGDDKTVRLWQAATGEELLILEGHTTRVNAVAFAPNGSTMASAGHDGSIRLWRAVDR
jgi:WD40 repeat protein/serine/threonine protein kinase